MKEHIVNSRLSLTVSPTYSHPSVTNIPGVKFMSLCIMGIYIFTFFSFVKNIMVLICSFYTCHFLLNHILRDIFMFAYKGLLLL